MPSPFPGMDPYLESPSIWPELHHKLIDGLQDELQPLLRPRYRAYIGERLIIEEPPPRLYYPDVSIHRPSVPPEGGRPSEQTSTLVADEPVLVRYQVEPLRQGFIEIRTRRGGQVVTVIEVLSPTNKAPGESRRQYLDKQESYLEAAINLVEIDLLRSGLHTLAAPPYCLAGLEGDYWVCVYRASQPGQFEIYPIPLRSRLPRVKVPLLPDDADVVLDLPAVFTRCYDRADYGSEIRYSDPPDPPLKPDQAVWAAALLQAASRRQG